MRMRRLDLVAAFSWFVFSTVATVGMPKELAAQATRPRLSRQNLAELKKRDRKDVFAALGSFDDAGLTDDQFTAQALDLIDPERVPGLAEARDVGDMAQARQTVFDACRRGRSAPASKSADPAMI